MEKEQAKNDKDYKVEDKEKFAKPDSPMFRAVYAQKRRKKRKEEAEV